ncbi:hypothetical protein KIPB_011216, partial [Kipferlia bialata]|eukprot:g11216.t1
MSSLGALGSRLGRLSIEGVGRRFSIEGEREGDDVTEDSCLLDSVDTCGVSVHEGSGYTHTQAPGHGSVGEGGYGRERERESSDSMARISIEE